jgi:hypothetical protein
MESIYAWYLTLYRHKAQYNFYLVYTNFISEFKRLIFGPNTSRLYLEETTFLSSKGIYETSKDFTIIRLFGGEENPFLLPFYVSDRIFTEEMCRKYKTWVHFFYDRRKK